jgi:hypothetical protein
LTASPPRARARNWRHGYAPQKFFANGINVLVTTNVAVRVAATASPLTSLERVPWAHAPIVEACMPFGVDESGDELDGQSSKS